VYLKIVTLRKPLLTYITLVRPYSSMCKRVSLKLCTCSKLLMAHVAFARFIARVFLSVCGENT